MRERARRHGLTLYDPQADELVRPPGVTDGGKKQRRWFRRS